MNILLLASHAVAEYDDIRMFTDMGYDVFCPGGYEVPGQAGEGIRPPLPNVRYHPTLHAKTEEVRFSNGAPEWRIDWGKANLHQEVIDWADVIIVHHFPEVWIGGQWDRIKHKRVIWRTCGQSDPRVERVMAEYRRKGLQIVRYSPKELTGFGEDFAGADAVIRFGKYPSDYGPWIGDDAVVGNVTQDMANRGEACGYTFWKEATAGLPAKPAGPGSEVMPGGVGSLSYEEMLDYLRHIRVYLYTGTRPASYTLGLLEAGFSGVPIVSIGPNAFGVPSLFEGHEFATWGPYDDPAMARKALQHVLENPDEHARELQAQTFAKHFGIDVVADRWRSFLEGGVMDPAVALWQERVA